MKVLVIGDIVGRMGREKVKELLPKIKKENNIDLVIANVENASGGMGLTIHGYDDLYMLGIDVMTMGNHTWAKREIFTIFDEKDNIIRPANYSNNVPGVGYLVTEVKGKKVLVINLLGRVDINIHTDCPFTTAEKISEKVKSKQNIDIVIVDFHAEATAEKIAMAYYLKDKATIVFGTHTHVQTSDERMFDTGMGYITDVGMTGPIESVLGMKVEVALKRFLTQIPERYSCATGPFMLNGVVFEFDEASKMVTKVTRISL